MKNFKLFARTEGNVQSYPVEFMSFPGGERHVRLSDLTAVSADSWLLKAPVYTPADLMDLMLVVDALRRMVGVRSRISLELPYVPYARQDRVALVGEPLSIKVFCNIINSLEFDSVEIWDPHSDVTPALLSNVTVRSTQSLMQLAFGEQGCLALLRECAFVAPDAGARKRVSMLARAFQTEAVYADKVRDPVTGKLSGAQVLVEVPQRPLLVVDDICDGGGTFVELARVLREKTDKPLYLYVTHGLFTKGLAPLQECYSRVFSANVRDQELVLG